jgi:glutathione S-transferase
MSKPKLTYFDAPVSRGEECRLALHVAGVDFDDERLSRAAWLERKPTAPFGAVPYLAWPGHGTIGQTNAILVLVGRLHGLHPSDPFEAARHEALMGHVEDLRGQIGPTMQIADAEAKKTARERLSATYLPFWADQVEALLGEGPFFAGEKLHVVDLKLLLAVRWIRGGSLDHIPGTAFDHAPKLNRLHDAVDAHPAVRAWYAARLPQGDAPTARAPRRYRNARVPARLRAHASRCGCRVGLRVLAPRGIVRPGADLAPGATCRRGRSRADRVSRFTAPGGRDLDRAVGVGVGLGLHRARGGQLRHRGAQRQP